jgi:hypothetical protein
MNGVKKNEASSNELVSAKIQRKFDLVFDEKPLSIESAKNDNFPKIFNHVALDLNTGLEKELVMEKNGKNSGKADVAKKVESQINLDFSIDDALDLPPIPGKAETPLLNKNDKHDFDFNFESAAEVKPALSEHYDEGGFTLDDDDLVNNSMVNEEVTKKTIIINRDDLKHLNLSKFTLEKAESSPPPHLIETGEAKANIESTIKEILTPKFDETKEFSLQELDSNNISNTGINDIEDSMLDFSELTPADEFELDAIVENEIEEVFSIDTNPAIKIPAADALSTKLTGEFDISELDASFSIEEDIKSSPVTNEIVYEASQDIERPRSTSTTKYEVPPSMGMGGSNMTSEDGIRFQATIRALREEREEMLLEIKELKGEVKEHEHDNLTLKANLDEAKIEISILRKRHMVEVEDIKYRLTMSEEKKAMADEKARQSDTRREKLEQKVRIDFNQVKQREKELESKLELLSMDVDSQVQSRDQKILELRRKIDALEFNMENASIKEQKSLDDKRKLEDRLNKIMKTLRHSIKNLEDDIDNAQVNDDHQKEKN